jgi:hypothetical protein
MSEFEFLSVLVSIVIGFGLTHLLGGLGHAYYFRRVSRMDGVHVAWSIAVFFVLVLNWWVFWLFREFSAWTFSVFFTVILWTASLYTLALALYPPRLSKDVDYRELFEANRTWFLSTFTIMCLLDLVVTSLRDQGMPELFYMVYVGHYAVITAVGVGVRNRKYDLVAAWYIDVKIELWSFGVRAKLF